MPTAPTFVLVRIRPFYSGRLSWFMEPIPADAERSLRRSRNRLRVLLMLSSLSEAYAGQLARATGVGRDHVRMVLHGAPPRYREELALIPLGLVVVDDTANGRLYRITSRGRRKARSWAARRRRL